MRESLVETALGIEIDPDVVARAVDIAEQMGVYGGACGYEVVQGDIRDERTRRLAERFGPMVIAGNLPYLPESPAIVDTTRDAGQDGLSLIRVQLEYMASTRAAVVSTNFSTLSTPEALFELVADSELEFVRVVAVTSAFGSHVAKLFASGVLEKRKGHIFHVDDVGPKHLMMNAILVRRGTPVATLARSDVERLVHRFAEAGAADAI